MKSLTNLEKQLDKLIADEEQQEKQHLFVNNLCLKVNHPNAIEYNPYTNSKCQTFEKFHSDNSVVKVLIGAFGSGKSTCCCADVVLKTIAMPPMRDGVRRARWAIVRNTMGMLESTTLVTWLAWFRNLGEVKTTKKPLLTYTHYFNDDKGAVEMELIFIGLDREEDKDKLESLELTGAYINEMQHVPHGVYTHLIGRIGRYPRVIDLEVQPPKYLLADTNPPDEDHWIHTDFESNPIEGNTIFHQPPGLIKNSSDEWIDNPDADNATHLSLTYYFDMARANHFREEYIKVYCRGEYGIVIPGKKVFPEYNDDLHSTAVVDILAGEPVLIGCDGGMTPCVVLAQLSSIGQVRIFKEFVTERSSVRALFTNWVIPYLDKNLSGFEIIVVTDPAMFSANENEGTSSGDVIEELGYEPFAAKTNNIPSRLEAQKALLNKMVMGQPAFLISRSECPTLRKSFSGKYCYKRVRIVGDEKYRDLPDKTHPWSDIMDCCEYIALEVTGDGIRFSSKIAHTMDFSIKEAY